MLNEFNYILVSGENDGGQFYNSCNRELDFTEDYEVCMQDMLFPINEQPTVRLGKNWIEAHYHKDATVVVVTPGNYKTAGELIDAVNKAIFPTFGKIEEKDGFYLYTVTETYGLRPSKELAIQLGVITQLSDPVPWMRNKWKVAINKIRIPKNPIQFMSVYADFVENTMIGPDLKPLLRLVPLLDGSGYWEHHMFTLQYYIPVKRCKIQEFGITIRQGLGGDVMDINGVVTIILHFRRINDASNQDL